jgi:hypothetical protein
LDGGSARRKAATYRRNKRAQTCMTRVGFEPTIPVLEPVKTFYALDGEATVIDYGQLHRMFYVPEVENYGHRYLHVLIQQDF